MASSCIEFRADGIPYAQPRHRSTIQNGRIHVYNGSPKVKHWKSILADAVREHLPAVPPKCPVVLVCDFDMPRPKRLQTKKSPEGPIPHTGKPDSDNLLKAVKDALTDAGVWHDDAQVYRATTEKQYHAKSGRPGVDIRIYFEHNTGDAA